MGNQHNGAKVMEIKAPKEKDLIQYAREMGSAGAVLILAVYIIYVQGSIIQANTAALARLTAIVEVIARDRGVPIPKVPGYVGP